jgi:hypothetical protein
LEETKLAAGRLHSGGSKKSRADHLDNMAKRTIRARLDEVNLKEKSSLSWPGWYALRRFRGTAVRAESTLETTSRALGNSKRVADKHYVKPTDVLPDVRKAVNDAVSGLTGVQRACNESHRDSLQVVDNMVGDKGLEPLTSPV